MRTCFNSKNLNDYCLLKNAGISPATILESETWEKIISDLRKQNAEKIPNGYVWKNRLSRRIFLHKKFLSARRLNGCKFISK